MRRTTFISQGKNNLIRARQKCLAFSIDQKLLNLLTQLQFRLLKRLLIKKSERKAYSLNECLVQQPDIIR